MGSFRLVWVPFNFDIGESQKVFMSRLNHIINSLHSVKRDFGSFQPVKFSTGSFRFEILILVSFVFRNRSIFSKILESSLLATRKAVTYILAPQGRG